MVIQGNRIAVEVKALLPRSPETRGNRRRKRGNPRLVWAGPICYIADASTPDSAGVYPHAVMAELVDALA